MNRSIKYVNSVSLCEIWGFHNNQMGILGCCTGWQDFSTLEQEGGTLLHISNQ